MLNFLYYNIKYVAFMPISYLSGKENQGKMDGHGNVNLAVITARSDSKGLQDKSIRDLCGKTLMAYCIEAAMASKCFSDLMALTDSDVYGNIAKRYESMHMSC